MEAGLLLSGAEEGHPILDFGCKDFGLAGSSKDGALVRRLKPLFFGQRNDEVGATIGSILTPTQI